MTSISMGDGQTSVKLRVGEVLRISLPENATTGYRWEFDHYDSDLLDMCPPRFANSSRAVGAGGTIIFEMIGRKAGETDVALKYWRHWEGDPSIIDRFQFRAAVTD